MKNPDEAGFQAYYDVGIREDDQEGEPSKPSDGERLLVLLKNLPEEEFMKLCDDMMVISISTGDCRMLQREELLNGPFKKKIERWERLGLECHVVDLIAMIEKTREVLTGIDQDDHPQVARQQICRFLCVSW